MQISQELPNVERKDFIKTLKTDLKNYNVKLYVYKDLSKRPKIDGIGFKKDIFFLKHFIKYWSSLVAKNNLDDYLQNELLKVIYDNIKQELITNIDKSELLDYIIEQNFKLENFKTMIKEDIKVINSSTYGNIELINYLNRTLEIKDILSKEVIRTIIMCQNYDLIRDGNRAYLEEENKRIKSNLDNTKLTIKNDLLKTKNKIKKLRRSINSKLLGGVLVLTLLISMLTGGSLLIKGGIDNGHTKYLTTYTTYSSVNDTIEETTYEPFLSEESTTMTIYSEPYLIDGRLFRDIKIYELDNLTEENDIDNILNIEFNVPIKPTEGKTVELQEDDIKEEYRIVTKMSQDETNVKKESVSFKKYFLVIGGALSIPILMSIVFGGKIFFDEKKYVKELNDKLKEEIYNWQYIYNQLIRQLESNDPILSKEKILIQEIIGYENPDDLENKYKLIIEDCNKVAEERQKVLETLETDKTHKLVKKLDKKNR